MLQRVQPSRPDRRRGRQRLPWPALAARDRLRRHRGQGRRPAGRRGARHSPAARSLAHRADERFPMCSTFKAMAVAAVLAKRRRRRRAAGPLRALRPGRPAGLRAGDPRPRRRGRHAAGRPLRRRDRAQRQHRRQPDPRVASAARPAGPASSAASATPTAAWTATSRPSTPRSPAIRATPRRPPRWSPTCAARRWACVCSRPRAAGCTLDGRLQDRADPAARRPAAQLAGRRQDRHRRPNGTANDIAVVWTPGGPIVIACYLTGADGVSSRSSRRGHRRRRPPRRRDLPAGRAHG